MKSTTEKEQQHQTASSRTRATRACDKCRESKYKCVRIPPDNITCTACISARHECTQHAPARPRGPAKGYVRLLERRLHQVEALLGVILSCPDQRAISLLCDVAQDEYAKEILDTLSKSPFGSVSLGHSGNEPAFLNPPTRNNNKTSHPTPTITGTNTLIDPFTQGPTRAWQSQLLSHIQRSSNWSTELSYGDIVNAVQAIGLGPLSASSTNATGNGHLPQPIQMMTTGVNQGLGYMGRNAGDSPKSIESSTIDWNDSTTTCINDEAWFDSET